MLTLMKFPTQLHCGAQLHDPTSRNFPKFQLTFSTVLNFRIFRCKPQAGLRMEAMKKGGALSESDEFGIDDDYDDDVFIPLDNMKKWLESKPRGFGEGKVYDTSIEDKLMEEIEQSRKAQVANVNKLKNGYVNQSVQKDTSKQHNESEDVKDGFRVRLANLPKKKNIHRDLRLAFEGVPGILNIVPIVSGNEKTRDPVCKGLAFIDFKSQDDAHRFVQKISATNICFGKVQKQIKCEMVTSKALDQLGGELNSTLEQADIFKPEVVASDSIWEDSVSSELDDDNDDDDDDGEEETWYDEDDGEIDDIAPDLSFSLGNEAGVGEESDTKSSKKVTRNKVNKKNASSPKQSKNKIPKLNIPGSAKRLKIREKAMLANVFSKYGGDSDLKVAETK